MRPTFNLLDEPWIKVTRLDGSPDELSLTEVFQQATDLRSIHGEIASQDVAILRLLIAISHRTMEGPEDFSTWKKHWNDPKLFGRDVVDYLEDFRDRFDVRHPEKPFFQVAGIHAPSGKVSGLKVLVADVPNGAPFFTTRIAEGLQSMTWAEATRWLVHVHAFDPSGIRTGAVGDPSASGGRSYPIGTGWTGQIGVIMTQGSTLAQTILLNTVVTTAIPDLESVDPELDLAPWEREPDTPAAAEDLAPTGPVSCCTWQTRRVLLHGDDDVTGVFLSNGDRATPHNRYLVESMSAWQYSEPQSKKLKTMVFMPRKLPTDRAFWHGLSSVIAQLSPKVSVKGAADFSRYRVPAVISFYQELMRRGVVPIAGLVPVHATGVEYRSNEAYIAELVEDVLSIPARLLTEHSEALLATVRDAMEESEQVAKAIRNLARNLNKAVGGDKNTMVSAATKASAGFYQQIDELFPRWLAALDRADPQSAREKWRSVLRDQALAEQDALTQALPPSAFAGRDDGGSRIDAGKALKWFQSNLNRVLPLAEHTHEGVS